MTHVGLEPCLVRRLTLDLKDQIRWRGWNVVEMKCINGTQINSRVYVRTLSSAETGNATSWAATRRVPLTCKAVPRRTQGQLSRTLDYFKTALRVTLEPSHNIQTEQSHRLRNMLITVNYTFDTVSLQLNVIIATSITKVLRYVRIKTFLCEKNPNISATCKCVSL